MRTRIVHRASVTRMLALVVLAAVAALTALWLAAKPAEAAFPGNNGRIAFDSGRDGDMEIYTMNPDGTDVDNITDNSYWDRNPAFSSDGEKIAFVSDRDGSRQIYTMNKDGSNQRRATNETGLPGAPAFSPDGTKIAYSVLKDEGGDLNYDIHVYDTDRMERTIVAQDWADEMWPAWSPDGTKIAYVRKIGASRYGKLTYTDMTNDTVHTIGGALRGEPREPNWSPDGSQLVFSMGGSLGYHIYKINSDGSSGAQRITGGSGRDLRPAFSPDGNRIAFERKHQIYTMDANGGNVQRRTRHPGNNYSPDWQPQQEGIFLPPIIDIPFCSIVDCVKPTITNVRPAPGSVIRDRTPTIRAKVSDDRRDLAKRDIKLWVDGNRKTTFSYNRDTDRLSYTTRRLRPNERHTVRVVASDSRNETTRRWGFRVL